MLNLVDVKMTIPFYYRGVKCQYFLIGSRNGFQ